MFIGGGKLNVESIAIFIDSDGVVKSVRSIRRSKDGADEWVKVNI
jgi:hypothetical protein